MIRSSTIRADAIVIGAVVAILAAPALAASQVYEYKIKHPEYGDIGTYTNVVQQAGGNVRVETKIGVAVKILGQVVYRRESERTEHWRGERLDSFQSITVTNGDRLEVRGEARDGGFVITSNARTIVAPANVRPSNPWSARLLRSGMMMSTTTGQVYETLVRESWIDLVTANGKAARLRQYEIVSDKREFVWVNAQDVPVAFRTEEEGTPIDFVLMRYSSQAPEHVSASLAHDDR
jgi:hypothetical protein